MEQYYVGLDVHSRQSTFVIAALGLTPQVIDTHEVRLKAHRPTQKSDRRDAFELCEGLRSGIYRAIVHVPRPEVSRFRETLARRRHFVRLQGAQVTAVTALLRATGLGKPPAARHGGTVDAPARTPYDY